MYNFKTGNEEVDRLLCAIDIDVQPVAKDSPCFDFSEDNVKVFPLGCPDATTWFAQLFHELGHWVGMPDRHGGLDIPAIVTEQRVLIRMAGREAGEELWRQTRRYSLEEVVAETCSACLCTFFRTGLREAGRYSPTYIKSYASNGLGTPITAEEVAAAIQAGMSRADWLLRRAGWQRDEAPKVDADGLHEVAAMLAGSSGGVEAPPVVDGLDTRLLSRPAAAKAPAPLFLPLLPGCVWRPFSLSFSTPPRAWLEKGPHRLAYVELYPDRDYSWRWRVIWLGARDRRGRRTIRQGRSPAGLFHAIHNLLHTED